jgi:hypothetical protein
MDYWLDAWYNSLMTFAWLEHNWFALAQTGILASGLFLLGFASLFQARARRITNLIKLTQQHRDLWERMYSQPELARILDPKADLTTKEISPEEQMFVVFIILHLNTTYFATRAGLFQKQDSLGKDIERFFSLPIPRAIWQKVKILQEPPFAKFVERYLPPPGQSAR